MKRLLFALVGFAASAPVWGASNFNAANSFSWSANTGWLNWRGDVGHGVEISQFICSGFIYSPNVGWIHLGSGTPANGAAYQNNSAADFGVNVDAQGNLRGLAYGANIGWIAFEEIGQPQIDLQTGQLNGHVYSANAGWMNLSDSTTALRVDSLTAGSDSDGDGIPDAWEIFQTGNLAKLSAQGDADKDGSTDLEEYLADTDPTNPLDNLRLFRPVLRPDRSAITLTWTTTQTRLYRIQIRSSFGDSDLWIDSGLGLLPPRGLVFSQELPNSAAEAQRYFRIQAVRPLAP